MRISRRFKLLLATGVAVVGGAVAATPSFAVHQTVTGLTNETPPQIVQFAVGTPGTLANGPSPIAFPMGATDTDLIGIDYRPRSSELFAMGSMGTVYTLVPPATFPGSWTATKVTGDPVTNQFQGGAQTAFGLDFNPAADRIRVVNNDPGGMTTNNNFRYRPDNGQPAVTPSDTDLAYGMTDPNFGTPPQAVAAAYTDNIDTAAQTTLYDIDAGTNSLVRQGGLNGMPSPNLGELSTIGQLTPTGGSPLNITEVAGFDIEGGTGTAYAALQPMGDAQSTFYRVNLASGELLSSSPSAPAAMIGPAATPLIESVSLVPASVLRFGDAVTSVAENGDSVDIVVVREGPLNRTTTVNVATEIAAGDTASAGDFTATGPVTLTFPTGNARQTLTVPITDDAADEPSETFTVRLSGPNVASNLQSPPTAQVQIVDDDAAQGALTPLVNVPQQSLKQVLKRQEVRYGYSCNRACDEDTTLLLKSGQELGDSSSSLAGAGASDEDISLNAAARRALRDAPGRNGVKVKLVSTFTDPDANEITLTSKLLLAR